MILFPLSTAQKASMRKILVEGVRAGKVFIYPTDTIYGIGCNALNGKSVRKIKKSKARDSQKPLSVIAPSKKWIRAHCKVKFPSYLSKLPGPYTLLLPKKKAVFLKEVSSTPILGVRMIDHPFQKMVAMANVPFVTTSVNRAGKPPIRRVGDIPAVLLKQVDYVIDAGPLRNSPSKLVNLTGEKPVHVRRKK